MPHPCPESRMPAGLRACLVGLALLLAAVPNVAGAQSGVRDPVELRLHVIDLLENEPRLPLPVRQRAEALLAYYQDADSSVLWVGSDRAKRLALRLQDAAIDGLRPDDYPGRQLAQLYDVAGRADTRGQATIELHFSAAFLEYASDLRVGRFLPNKVDPNFFLQARTIDPVAALQGLRAAADLDAFLDRWEPQSPHYADLRDLLFVYRELAAHGGWQTVPLGEVLKPGMEDERVPALRARLALTDGAEPAAVLGAEHLYDDGLVATVQRFQRRHGLDVDGVIGPATIGALNTPIEERIRNIIVAMERWRWMPEELGTRHIMVNIAGFELRRVDNGVVEEKMAVVVGKPYHRTPVFSDMIEYAEFNPYWNVPISITLNEELAKLRSDPASRAASGFEAVLDGQVYDLRSIDWNRYGPGNFPFRLRQRPGANNALGRVKLMFPNRHNVYLHDTPARSLFSRAERAFSHGCIRLARPLDLAGQVLAAGGVSGWDRGRVDAVVASGERTVVSLARPLPVHITYLTAWVDNGQPQFRKDIYNHDEKLMAALDGRAIAW